MTAPFRLEPLGGERDRSLFRCGEDALDSYFQMQVTEDIRRHMANCFVAVEAVMSNIAAWYTISSASIPLVDLPPDETRRLPRYPTVPAVRIGRLAVDRRFQGRGLGAALLADAASRALKADAAAFTLLVDAKHDRAAAFYQRFGFQILASQPRTLFLPLATARKVFPQKDAR
jgi:ribosomal protein S18 acetylase RimI-like enzyme